MRNNVLCNINNKMIQGELDNTLDEAQFKRRQTAAFDDHVSINYENQFSYLNDPQFSGQHLELSHIQINPSQPPLNLTFFQEFSEQKTSDLNSVPTQMNRHAKRRHKRKIVELKMSKFGSFEGETVRLPKQQSNRVITVQLLQEDDLQLLGMLPETEGINKIQLLDKSLSTVYQMTFLLKNNNKKEQSEYDNLSQQFEEAFSVVNMENTKPSNNKLIVKNKQRSQNESFHVPQKQYQRQQYQDQASQENEDIRQSFHVKDQQKQNSNNIIKPPPTLISKESKTRNQQNSIVSSVNVDINKTQSYDFVQSVDLKHKKVKQSTLISKQQQNEKDKNKMLRDSEEDQKIKKHTPPKISTSLLLQQALASPQKHQKSNDHLQKQQIATQYSRERKQMQGERQLLLQKYRQLTHQKQKVQQEQSQLHKRSNRYAFKTIKTVSPEHQKDYPQSYDPLINESKNTSNIYKMPVDILSSIRLRSPESKTTHTNKSHKKDAISFVHLEGKNYLQKFIKASLRNCLQPVQRQNSLQIKEYSSNIPSIQVAQLSQRKAGFIKSHRGSIPKKQQSLTLKEQASQQKCNEEAISLKHFNTKALKMNTNILEIKVGGKTANKKSLSKVLDEQYTPPTLVNSTNEPGLKKIDRQKREAVPSRKQSTEKSTAPRITLKSIKKRSIEAQTDNKLQVDQSSNKQTSEEPSCAQEKDLDFDIIINNLSVNLYSKVFGRKYMEMTLGSEFYTTDYLHGSHLLWVGKGYLFKQVGGTKQIQLSLKCQVDGHLKILGLAKINISELLLNYKQSFYQTYLFTPQHQLLAVIIIGYQILNHFPQPNYSTVSRDYNNSPITHPVLPKTTKKTKAKALKMKEPPSLSQSSFDQQLQTRYKKYKGGYNIRLGRASRFVTEHANDEPGPGHYQINSSFERHTVSRRDK